MQACKVSPPPPGALGADSLGLGPEAAEVDEDDVVVELDEVVVEPPPLELMIWAGPGERGAMAACWGAGAAMAEGGKAVVVDETDVF